MGVPWAGASVSTGFHSDGWSLFRRSACSQDFHAAFGLGVSDKLIDTIDSDGVVLAAIQGLNAELEERLAEKDAEIAELRERLERLEAVMTVSAK